MLLCLQEAAEARAAALEAQKRKQEEARAAAAEAQRRRQEEQARKAAEARAAQAEAQKRKQVRWFDSGLVVDTLHGQSIDGLAVGVTAAHNIHQCAIGAQAEAQAQAGEAAWGLSFESAL
jgi:FKBP-type peptidyl-prolyl cis-trans isomerase